MLVKFSLTFWAQWVLLVSKSTSSLGSANKKLDYLGIWGGKKVACLKIEEVVVSWSNALIPKLNVFFYGLVGASDITGALGLRKGFKRSLWP